MYTRSRNSVRFGITEAVESQIKGLTGARVRENTHVQ